MKTEGEARIEGAHRQRIDGEAWIEVAKRPKIEGKVLIEGKTRDKSGRGVWGGVPASPNTENLRKINFEMMQPGEYFTSKLPDLAIVYILKAGPDGNKIIQWEVWWLSSDPASSAAWGCSSREFKIIRGINSSNRDRSTSNN